MYSVTYLEWYSIKSSTPALRLEARGSHNDYVSDTAYVANRALISVSTSWFHPLAIWEMSYSRLLQYALPLPVLISDNKLKNISNDRKNCFSFYAVLSYRSVMAFFKQVELPEVPFAEKEASSGANVDVCTSDEDKPHFSKY